MAGGPVAPRSALSDAAALELALTFLHAPALTGPVIVDGKFVRDAGPDPAWVTHLYRAYTADFSLQRSDREPRTESAAAVMT